MTYVTRRTARPGKKQDGKEIAGYAAGGAQRNARNRHAASALRGFGHQDGQHPAIERVRGPDGVEIGEEIEVIDDTAFHHDLMRAVVGQQIAAERGEMRRVLLIDVDLVSCVRCDQNQQQQSGVYPFGCFAYHLSAAKSSTKKGPHKTVLQKYPQMGMYVVSCTRPERTMRRRCPAGTGA